ncbi:MAG: hypothetical protein JXP73_04590 [Deltaproteobacteria bacterium]|jgi:hypothetical protein|nr:hypothetical protein [Deltaproteobacteria bacterium]
MDARNLRWLLSALVAFALGAACTYAPHPEEGKQECYQGRCVDGYVCGWDNYCYTPARLPTAPGAGGAAGALPGGGGAALPGTGGVGAGGIPGSGGATGRGGIGGGMGGFVGTGGASSSGGIRGTGGVTSIGGVSGAGGTTSTGGMSAPPNSGTVMTIANGQAQGAMTGFGWIALGELDTVTDPTCNSPAGPILSGLPCDETIWSTPAAYCVSGSIPALPVSPTPQDYDDNWGIQIGVNATPVEGGVLGQSFSGLSVTMTGSPASGLRVLLHRRGDAETTSYCSAITPGTSVSFSRFSTDCWDAANPGTYIASADVPYVDKIGIQVPSASSAIAVNNLCLVGITFVK